MEKDQIVQAVRRRTAIGKRDADRAVDAVFEAITDSLREGGEVRLVGFGTFSVASRAASEGRNPRTGEKIKIAASKQATFRPGRRLRDQLMGVADRTRSRRLSAVEELVEEQAPQKPGYLSNSPGSQAAEEEDTLIARAADLLGGPRVLRRQLHRPLEAHEAVRQGLPREALSQLISNVSILPHRGALERALGISLRSAQRFKAAPQQALSTEQSGRAWKFATILARATQALGSHEEAERWLETPAMALDRQRPIDLLATPAGTQLVDDLLGRIEYGVYT